MTTELAQLYKRGDLRRSVQTTFAGVDRRKAAGNGAIYDMQNMCAEEWPLLQTRRKRYIYGSGGTVQTMRISEGGLFAANSLWRIVGRQLYKGDNPVGSSTMMRSSAKHTWAALGERVIICPEMILVDSEGNVEQLEYSITVDAFFKNKTWGEDRPGRCVLDKNNSQDWGDINVGDAVTISGSSEEGNNVTAIVREKRPSELLFDENTFETVTTTAEQITVKREVPEMDFIFSHGNRVWGCKGDTIYCSKLGDPFNWNVFDGLSTDSWSVSTGTPGDFTGCISYMGHPMFFKENRVFKVNGTRPQNFELVGEGTLGVKKNNHWSMAVAGESLIYLSRAGFVACRGSYPVPIGKALHRSYDLATGGSDGVRYVVSARYQDETWTNRWELLSYETGAWHKEDSPMITAIAWKDGLWMADWTNERLLLAGGTPNVPSGMLTEGDVESSVTFGDWEWGSFDSKHVTRLWIRAEAETTATLTAEIRYDGGTWEEADSWTLGEKSSRYLTVPIRRCDHYALRLSADKAWTLYAVGQEFLDGSERRR